jgi:hypothetical protein
MPRRCVGQQIDEAGGRLPSRAFIPPTDDARQHKEARYYIRLFSRARFGRVPKIYTSALGDLAEAELNSVLAQRPELFERVDVNGKVDPNGHYRRLRLERYEDTSFDKRKH